MIGKTVSHYTILEELGRGGMGVVYRAEDTKLGRTVALKFLPPEFTRDPEAKERFAREAQAAAALNHPNICTVYEIDEHEGRSFIAMEYIDGESLGDRIGRGPLPLDEAIDIAGQVSCGLHIAHEHGIVHRDIKPANLMIAADGRVKIMDFGLAKSAGKTQLTREGTTLGTIQYMSPEQAQGEEIDHRTDIWSTGVVLYEMLTGRQPFKRDYDQAVMYSIINEDPEPITGLRTGVPPALERLAGKALSKDRSERYQHADEMLADLNHIKRGLEQSGGKMPQGIAARGAARKRSKAVITTIAIVCALAIGFILLKPVLFEEQLISASVPIAVISFENHTGDPAYDYLRTVIPNLLITSLEQSKYIRVATWERLRDLRRQIGKGDEGVIGKDLGFELCRLEGIRAIAFGTFTKAGDVFVTDVKVLDVESKELLKSASAQGRGVGSILERQIDELSREISRGIGLSEPKKQKAGVRISDVTTTSMEAYNYFIRGREDYDKFYFDDALKFLGKAVAIDSTFAAAHLYLGDVHFTLGNIKASLEAYKRAKSFSNRASEKERLLIEASYAMIVEHDLDKQLDILMEIAGKYPREKQVHIDLAQHYTYSKGRHDDAIAEYQKVLALDPNHARAYNQLAYLYALRKGDFEKAMEYLDRYASLLPGDANPLDSRGELYIAAGMIEEAISVFKEVLEIKPDFPYVGVKLAYLYCMKEDFPEAIKWTDYHISVTSSKAWQGGGYALRGIINYIIGDEERSLEDCRTAAWLAEEIDNIFWKTAATWIKGWIYYERGVIDSARAYLENPLDSIEQFQYAVPSYPPVMDYHLNRTFACGMMHLLEGDLPSARARLAEFESIMDGINPNFIDIAKIYRSVLEAKILMSEGNYARAIEVLEKAPPREIPLFAPSYLVPYNNPHFMDLLAQAYVHHGQPEKAIAEYERLTTIGPVRKLCPLVHPLCHYRLALLYQETGQKRKAVERYERFLSTWVHADRQSPEIVDAKARLAHLTKSDGL